MMRRFMRALSDAQRTIHARWRQADYRKVFGGSDGARVKRDLYHVCFMDRPTHVPGDPIQTAHNEGMRRVGLRIANILHDDPDRIAREMINSQQSEDDYGIG